MGDGEGKAGKNREEMTPTRGAFLPLPQDSPVGPSGPWKPKDKRHHPAGSVSQGGQVTGDGSTEEHPMVLALRKRRAEISSNPARL